MKLLRPLVIVNSVCPGPTATDLNRSLSAASVLYRYIAPVIVMALGQNAEVGARAYAEAGLIPAEHHVRNLDNAELECQFLGNSRQQLTRPYVRVNSCGNGPQIRNTTGDIHAGFPKTVKLTATAGNLYPTSAVHRLKRSRNWCGKKSARNWCPRYLQSAAYSMLFHGGDHNEIAFKHMGTFPQRSRSLPCRTESKG